MEILEFEGEPIIPQVLGFSRVRKSGVIQNEASAGTRRQRKKFFNMPHEAEVSFYLGSPAMIDYMQTFINLTEGDEFICYLAADRPIIEPYLVQAVSEWSFPEVNALESTVTCVLEILTERETFLDQFLSDFYTTRGEDTTDILLGLTEIVEAMPENDT